MNKINNKIIQDSDIGYAYSRIIFDKKDRPCDYEIIKINKSFQKYTGLDNKDLSKDKMCSFLFCIVEENIDILGLYKRISKNGEGEEYEKYLEDRNRWCRIQAYSPKKDYIVISCEDITEIKNLEDRLKALKNSFSRTEQLIKLSRTVIWELDKNGICKYLSPVSKDVFGYNPEDAIGKMHVDQAFDEYAEESYRKSILPMIKRKEIIRDFESKLITKSNEEIWVSTNGFPILDDAGELLYYRGISIDITCLKKVEEEIKYLSFRDQLTGLYNRRFFEEELERLDTERNLPLSLIMIDVDGLKLINDALGHREGDLLLKRVAETIQKECRLDDIISRIGGDEFVILLPKTSKKETRVLMERIDREIKKQHLGAINISISYGWETKRNTNENINDVFKKADIKMYNHKNKRKENIRKKNIEKIQEKLFRESIEEKHHSKGVVKLAVLIGQALKLSDREIENLKIIGKYHDIGKIVISKDILNKEDELTHEEWEEVKRHSELGYIILSSSNEYVSIAKDVLHHHERYDGRGYPRRLKGEEIPLNSRIIALADSYDTITRDRPYRKAVSEEEAKSIILEESGKQFDPELVKVFLESKIGEKYKRDNI